MNHEVFMRRCFELAVLGSGSVSPNPMVGAVLVFENRIIGEGWHKAYGAAHAEVNAVNSVQSHDRHLISCSTLYVSLEPCCTHGNTPACTDLIIQSKIPNVVVSCLDKTKGVNGTGISILKNAGVEVIPNVLSSAGEVISRFRNTFVTKNRPYVTLKFAVSADGKFGQTGRQVWLSDVYSKRYVHRLRSEYDAILVGTNTVLIDNPELTNRLWYGRSPIRVVLDRNLEIPNHFKVYNNQVKTLIFTEKRKTSDRENLRFVQIDFEEHFFQELMAILAKENITSMIVEGGARTIQRFLDSGYWDEAQVITSPIHLKGGINAPVLHGEEIFQQLISADVLTIYRNAS